MASFFKSSEVKHPGLGNNGPFYQTVNLKAAFTPEFFKRVQINRVRTCFATSRTPFHQLLQFQVDSTHTSRAIEDKVKTNTSCLKRKAGSINSPSRFSRASLYIYCDGSRDFYWDRTIQCKKFKVSCKDCRKSRTKFSLTQMGFCLYRTHTPVNLYPKADRYKRKMAYINHLDSIKEEEDDNIIKLTQSADSQSWIAPAYSQNHGLVKQYDFKRMIFQFYSWAGLFIPQNGQGKKVSYTVDIL